MPLSQARESLSAQAERAVKLLLPHLSRMTVDAVSSCGGVVRIWVRAAAAGARCPRCGAWCTTVRDSYRRRLRDAPSGGQRVVIWLLVRVLKCGNDECGTGRFTEQPEGLVTRYARATSLLAGQLETIAVMLAGRPGSRLARAVLAVEVSRHTLIRTLLAVPDPPAGPVRVLGADDFSLRRGHTYATLLVDMETGDPVDVLPDREAATLQKWLEDRPGTEVICRDRAGAYAQAARDGAPDAIQVADRWHLWHNLCEHARTAVTRHKDCLAGSCRHRAPGQPQDPPPAAAGGDGPGDLEAVIRERHAQVHALRAAGRTPGQAAAALCLTRQVTGRFWRAATAEMLLAARSTSAAGPYLPHLRQRWDQGATQITMLHNEITALGYAGSYGTTYASLAMLRLAQPARPPAPPTPREVTRLLLRNPGNMDPAGLARLAAVRGLCPEIDALADHIAAFAKILTQHLAGKLDDWITAISADPAQPELQSFTTGLHQDIAAVRNALTLPWSSGPVEGLNTRTKAIKRAMYGRATFRLLRKRILLRR